MENQTGIYSQKMEKMAVRAISVGLVAIAMMGCVPVGTEAYYVPLTDQIIYLETPTPEDIIHEETHKSDANSYPGGRIIWGMRYATDRKFACEAELKAGADTDHPACLSE
ncbi:MAG: hypothetical protein NUV44_10850 [Candidatus Scalindua sp.]|nr:hypothetical protein [Candidatus Scalindua sp.]